MEEGSGLVASVVGRAVRGAALVETTVDSLSSLTVGLSTVGIREGTTIGGISVLVPGTEGMVE